MSLLGEHTQQFFNAHPFLHHEEDEIEEAYFSKELKDANDTERAYNSWKEDFEQIKDVFSRKRKRASDPKTKTSKRKKMPYTGNAKRYGTAYVAGSTAYRGIYPGSRPYGRYGKRAAYRRPYVRKWTPYVSRWAPGNRSAITRQIKKTVQGEMLSKFCEPKRRMILATSDDIEEETLFVCKISHVPQTAPADSGTTLATITRNGREIFSSGFKINYHLQNMATLNPVGVRLLVFRIKNKTVRFQNPTDGKTSNSNWIEMPSSDLDDDSQLENIFFNPATKLGGRSIRDLRNGSTLHSNADSFLDHQLLKAPLDKENLVCVVDKQFVLAEKRVAVEAVTTQACGAVWVPTGTKERYEPSKEEGSADFVPDHQWFMALYTVPIIDPTKGGDAGEMEDGEGTDERNLHARVSATHYFRDP